MILLHQDTTYGKVGSIGVKLKWLDEVRERKDGLLGDELLQGIEGLSAFLTPCPSSSLVQQVSERGGYYGITLDESSVVFHQGKE